MIKVIHCPVCLGHAKHQRVGNIRGAYCKKCEEWGVVAEFRHMHLAWMYLRWKLKEVGEL